MSDADLYPTPLAAALMYRVMGVAGWRVAPTSPGSKVPSIREWQTAGTTDETTILGWWTSQPDAGVCIVTGRKTGLWVLDVDVSAGKQGLETLRQLVADNGGEGLGETLVVRTPSGGYHYYFAYPPEGVEVHNSASNRLGPGLDVRGEGGQVNAPPTKRGEGGYRWADGRAPWSAEVQQAPAWLLELVKDRPRTLTPAPTLPPVHSPVAALRISDVEQHLTGVPTFVTDYNAATGWDALLSGHGWTLDHSDANGVSYWVRPGKDGREGISASTNYAGADLLYVWSTSIPWLPSDRAYDKYGYMVHRDHAGDFDAAAQRFIEERRSAAQLAPSTTGAELPTPTAPKPETAPERPQEDGEQSRYSLLSVDFDPEGAFWNADVNATDFLISPFIARGRGHALYASAKAGKSYVVLQAVAAACIPNHASWADPVDEMLTIVYLDYEMTEADLRQRLEAFGYSKTDDYSRFHYVKAGALGADLDTYEGGQDLAMQAVEWGADLVVVDTLSRAVRGEENDADTMRDFYRFTGSPLKANGIAVLRLDHAGKDSGKGQRGTSAKNDDVDIVWSLDKLDAGARLSLTHSRVFWIDPEILLSNVHHGDGSLHHERTGSIDEIAGIGAKAQEWIARGIPLETSRERLRDEYGLSFKDAEFRKIRERAQEIASLATLVSDDGSHSRSRPFALGTVERSEPSKPVPSLALPKGVTGNRQDAGTFPDDLQQLQETFGGLIEEDR